MNIRVLLETTFPTLAADLWLLIFRILIGLFMLTHGVPKFENLMSGGEIKFADPFGMGAAASLALTVFAEVFCSLLLIIGLATRFASIPLIITMVVAVFLVHSGKPFGEKELASMYLIAYITFFAFGPGKYSADFFISNRLNR